LLAVRRVGLRQCPQEPHANGPPGKRVVGVERSHTSLEASDHRCVDSAGVAPVGRLRLRTQRQHRLVEDRRRRGDARARRHRQGRVPRCRGPRHGHRQRCLAARRTLAALRADGCANAGARQLSDWPRQAIFTMSGTKSFIQLDTAPRNLESFLRSMSISRRLVRLSSRRR
jgi:hypothetical protein